MPTYIFRNRYNKVIRGTTSASSENHLFDKIDDQADPFAFEYCKTSTKTLWLDEEPVWLMFDASRSLISTNDSDKELIDSLKNKIDEAKFDNIPCFVMARNSLTAGDFIGAIQYISRDLESLMDLDKKLYDYTNFLISN